MMADTSVRSGAKVLELLAGLNEVVKMLFAKELVGSKARAS